MPLKKKRYILKYIKRYVTPLIKRKVLKDVVKKCNYIAKQLRQSSLRILLSTLLYVLIDGVRANND